MKAEKYVGKRLLEVWANAAATGLPHASIRFSEAEALVAAHDEIVTMKAIDKLDGELLQEMQQMGVSLPDALARIRLVESLREADLLGILEHHDNRWQGPMADMVMKYYGIAPRGTFFAYENLFVAKMKSFYRLFRDYKVLLVGEHAERCAEVMSRRYGWNVAGTLHCPVADGLDRAQRAMERISFHVAFISCGIPGKMLTAHAKRLGRQGIDIGSTADLWLQSDAEDQDAWQWPLDRFPKANWRN